MMFNDLRSMGFSKDEIYAQRKAIARMSEEELNELGRKMTGGCDTCFPLPIQSQTDVGKPVQ